MFTLARLHFSLTLGASLLLPSFADAAPCVPRLDWPTTDWATQIDIPSRAEAISELEHYAFRLVGKDSERKDIRTDAVIVVQDGAIIYERYARSFNAAMPHKTWSVSKSVMNALAGLAVGAGRLDLNASICNYVSLPRLDNCDITTQHLLEFASGLDWNEGYEGEAYTASSVLAMLFGQGRADNLRFVMAHDKREPAGTSFYYSSGDAAALSAVVHATLRVGEDYPWTLLFDRLGMTSAAFERDGRGVFVGASHFYATPRDLAKFGFFYLNDGCWENQRLLPEDWVARSVTVSQPYRNYAQEADDTGSQGWQFWLNRAVPEQHLELPWPDVPDDAYAARGHWGQSITVVPSRRMVIVRTGDDRDESAFNFNHFLRLALALGN